MKTTDDLILSLSQAPPGVRGRLIRWRGGVIAGVSALTAWGATVALGLREDLGVQLTQGPFLLKISALVFLALAAARWLSRVLLPDGGASGWGAWVGVALGLGAIGWGAALTFAHVGGIAPKAFACLLWIPLIGVGPFAFFVALLRYGAPVRPSAVVVTLALGSWAVSSLAYALHCNADLLLGTSEGNLIMLFLYALALPVFLLPAWGLRHWLCRW